MTTRKSKKLLGLIVAGLLLSYPTGYAAVNGNGSGEPAIVQQAGKTVTGVVVDVQGEPLIGVSVSAQGTNRGVVTDANGQYSIQVQGDNQTLRFSYIGYKPVTVAASKSVIDVTMEEDANALGEVVITAMGIKKEKKALGYSVQDIKSDELLKVKTANPLNSLAGKIAGVNITQSSGAAGAGAQIQLRGGTSLSETRDNQPLFVVDGIIYDNSTSAIGNTAFDGMGTSAVTNSNRIMDINPEDIENISVLKGPAASALYGSRAANGVLIITTKKGVEGTVSVDFSSKYSSAWANRLPEQQSTFGRGAYQSDGTLNPTGVIYSSWGAPIGNAPIYNNMEAFFQNGTTWDNTVNVSGGHKNGSFYFSASNFDQTGIVPGTGYDKTTFRLNAEQKYDRLTLSVGAAYSQANTQKTLTSSGLYDSGGTGTMNQVYRWARNEDMSKYLNADGSKYVFEQYRNPDGSRNLNNYPLGNLVENPYWLINKNNMTDHTNRFTGNGAVDFKITEWWNITYRTGIDSYTTGNHNLIAPGGELKSHLQNGMLSENVLDYQFYSTNLMTNLNKKFGDYELGMLLGWNEEETKREYNYRMGINFPDPDMPTFSTITAENETLSQSHSMQRIRSYYGELRASWKSTAYLTVTGRNDKSSTLYSPILGDKNASYFYPSVSGSVVFSELLPKNDILSFGKVRASWAKVGKATDPYVTNTTLWDSQEFIQGKTSTSTYWYRGNPYLLPEMTTSVELGLDARFLDGRVGFDLTWYKNNSYNQILNPRTSQATGFIFNYTNIGEIYNKGLELSISGQPIKTKYFTWDATLNIAGNRGTVGKIHPSLPILYVTSVQVGNAKAASFENGNFMAISGSRWETPEYAIGKLKLKDESGALSELGDMKNAVVLDQWGMPTSDNATTYDIANREPKFTGGFNNSLQYKNWNFSFLLDFRKGGAVYNGTEYWMTSNGMSPLTVNRDKLTLTGVIQTGTKEGIGYDASGNEMKVQIPVYEKKEVTFEANGTYPVNSTTYQSGRYIIQQYWSDYYLKNSANFMTETNWLRLRSVSLSYSLPKQLLEKTKAIKGCTFSFTGTNLLLLTNYKGLDPESSAAGSGIGGSSSVGIEYCNVPATAGISFGVNLKF
ncbi:MAG: SusC/RagA family TonB-linked outer membrane protein [Dysgonamonadaceae bacterium]|jgi:TonB-linked SusC/RagA family outer membrane protein|nr:SusC/RagA family TonB-linked outer membrane protein [Dysgonamonadaceae bacterium]